MLYLSLASSAGLVVVAQETLLVLGSGDVEEEGHHKVTELGIVLTLMTEEDEDPGKG